MNELEPVVVPEEPAVELVEEKKTFEIDLGDELSTTPDVTEELTVGQ